MVHQSVELSVWRGPEFSAPHKPAKAPAYRFFLDPPASDLFQRHPAVVVPIPRLLAPALLGDVRILPARRSAMSDTAA